MIVMKLKKKKQTKIYICTCMYNILLIYQIGVDVSTHPMVLSVPVQFSLTQQTHTHMHYEIVPRCTHTCASKRARSTCIHANTHTYNFVGERIRMRAMLDFEFHFSFFQVWNDKSVSQNRKKNFQAQNCCNSCNITITMSRNGTKFLFRKKNLQQQQIICQGISQFANKIVFFKHLLRIKSKIRVALIQ